MKKAFIAEAKFDNPYAPSYYHKWDFGFYFYYTNSKNFQAVVVASTGLWKHVVCVNGSIKETQKGQIQGLRTGATDSNRLRLYVNDTKGKLYVNGKLVGTLTLETPPRSSYLAVGTGFYGNTKKQGATTNFSDFTIWWW